MTDLAGRQREHGSTSFDGGSRHPVDCAGGLVLNNCQNVCTSQINHRLGPIRSHTRQQDRRHPARRLLEKTPKENICSRSVSSDGRRLTIEAKTAVAINLEMLTRRGDSDFSRLESLSSTRDGDIHREIRGKPIGKSIFEAIGNVLDNGNAEIRAPADGGQHLENSSRTSRRCADRNTAEVVAEHRRVIRAAPIAGSHGISASQIPDGLAKIGAERLPPIRNLRFGKHRNHPEAVKSHRGSIAFGVPSRCQNKYRGVASTRQLLDQVAPIHRRQIQIHHDCRRAHLGSQPEGFCAVSCVGHNFDPGCVVDHSAQDRPDGHGAIGKEHRRLGHRPPPTRRMSATNSRTSRPCLVR